MNRPRSGPWGAFLPLVPVLGLVWERFHTYWEAQQPAVTTAALIGHGLLQGRPLYSDLWDPHPPALSLSYALAEALGGDGPYSIFLLGLGTGLGTLAALTLAGRAYGGPAAGLLAACLWAIVSGDPTVWANQPLAGSFVNLFAAWALWFLLEEGKGRPGTRAKLAAGTLLGIASLYQLSVVALGAAWALAGAFLDRSEGRRPDPGWAWVALGAVAVWVLMLSYFSATGRWGDFTGAVFSYPLHQLAVGSADLSIGRLWPSGLVFAAPFLTAALVGAAGVLFRKPRPWLLGSVYLGWVWVETSAAGFTPASYQAWLPPLVLGAAWGAWEWGAGKRPWAAVLPAVLLILCALGEEAPYYRLWAAQWSGLKSGVDAAGTYALARDLKDMLGPGETFFEWGDETQLYYLTRQTPPSGILECTPAITGPLAGRLGDRLAADLKRAKPDLFLVNRAETREVGPSDPVAELLRREYRPLGAKPAPGDILFFVRAGSPLDRRYGGTRP